MYLTPYLREVCCKDRTSAVRCAIPRMRCSRARQRNSLALFEVRGARDRACAVWGARPRMRCSRCESAHFLLTCVQADVGDCACPHRSCLSAVASAAVASYGRSARRTVNLPLFLTLFILCIRFAAFFYIKFAFLAVFLKQIQIQEARSMRIHANSNPVQAFLLQKK